MSGRSRGATSGAWSYHGDGYDAMTITAEDTDLELRLAGSIRLGVLGPRGWHCLGLAGGFRDGDPHAVPAFGTKLVVFADSSGALHVLDSYCRHMGGDLSQGTVKGDAIACPFHDWRWGGDGRCAAIPYARRVPVTARTRSWRTLERNGHLFVWNDPEGNPPPDDVTIPLIEGASSAEWTEWTWDSILVEGANCRWLVASVLIATYLMCCAGPSFILPMTIW